MSAFKGGIIIRLLLPVIFIGVAIGGYSLLSKKPKPIPAPPPTKKKIEAEVLEMKLEDYQIIVKTQGAVRASSEVNLSSQVGGRIQSIHPVFNVGAFVKKDQVLLELNPIDFEVALIAAQSQLAQAELFFAQEQTRANQAELNWNDLEFKDKGDPSDLVLRKPQLKQAEASVKLAQAQLESAKRNLERAKVKAPFDGRILTRTVGVGQTIGASTPLGIIVSTDYSEVRLPISTRSLSRVTLPEDTKDESLDILLRNSLVESSTNTWNAIIQRSEGALDQSTLELFAIARIDDPFGLQTGRPPLRVGQPVLADIPGEVLRDVYVIPRAAVIGLSRIRIADPITLKLGTANVVPVWSDEESIVFRNAKINEGTLLIMTRLVYAPDGSPIEIIDPNAEEEIVVPKSLVTSTNKKSKGVGKNKGKK